MNQHHNEPEVKEIVPEESRKVKGYFDLSKHKPRKPRRSKKSVGSVNLIKTSKGTAIKSNASTITKRAISKRTTKKRR